MSLFAKFNACSILNCDESTFRNWLSLIESHYHPNPYHNSTHAADVMQATAYFLLKPRLKVILKFFLLVCTSVIYLKKNFRKEI